MPNAMQAGAVVYAKDVARISDFYAGVAGLHVVHAERAHVVLESDGFQLVVVAIPPKLAATIEVSVPPRIREDVAVKLVFWVPDLEDARQKAGPLGGEVKAPEHEWKFRGSRVCDGHDPEGNTVQFREANP